MPGRRGDGLQTIMFISWDGPTLVHIEGGDLPLRQCKVLLSCEGGQQLYTQLQLAAQHPGYSLYNPVLDSDQDLKDFLKRSGLKDTARLFRDDGRETLVGEFRVVSESV
jgi:hypothetical protein